MPSTHLKGAIALLFAALAMACGESASEVQGPTQSRDERIAAIHDRVVFADIHSHPSHFHRWNVERIAPQEIGLFRLGRIDLVVTNVSSDAAFLGGYVTRDGYEPPRLTPNDRYELEPGEAFAFTLDRVLRVVATVESGDAVLATSPEVVRQAKEAGQISLMAALEGADGLEGSIDNLRTLHANGLRLVQLVHFLDNDIGGNQTAPHDGRGLSEFGAELIRECNRLGIIVDLAHANTRTIMEALAVSSEPMVFSHGGVKALYNGSRYLTDEEIIAIADAGGVIGIWPASALETIPAMVRHIDHVRQLAGIDHVAIASDLRGMTYIDAFGPEANYRAILDGLINVGFSDDEIGKVMGGNFFALWSKVADGSEAG